MDSIKNQANAANSSKGSTASSDKHINAKQAHQEVHHSFQFLQKAATRCAKIVTPSVHNRGKIDVVALQASAVFAMISIHNHDKLNA